MSPGRMFLLVMCGCLAAGSTKAAQENLTQKFRNGLKGIDRIVVERTDYDLPRLNEGPVRLLELKGGGHAESLGLAVEVEHPTEHCLCITSPAVRFYAGEHLRFSLTLHHSNRLRDENGPWLDGDVKLTDASAGKFRAWFAERGYTGFVEGHEYMLREQQKYRDFQERLRGMFPDHGKDLPEEEKYLDWEEVKRRAAVLSAKFPDRPSCILACWRGLGQLEVWSRYRNDQTQDFLLKVLQQEKPGDLRLALTALLDTDASAWVGAYYHYAETARSGGRERTPDSMQEVVDTGWLINLVRNKLKHDRDPLSRFTISRLKEHDKPEVRSFLIEIAEGSWQGEPEADEHLKNDYWAMQTLAQLGDTRAGWLAAGKLSRGSTTPQEKLALEVICAQFDRTVQLGLEHLTETEGTVAEQAWALQQSTAGQLPIETLLVLAEKTDSYRVKSAVKALLETKGLRWMEQKERFESLWAQSYAARVETLAETRRALREVEAMPVVDAARRQRAFLLARLRYHEGRHLIATGDFEEARSSLIQAEESEAVEELVAANLATGRLDQAMIHIRLGDNDAAGLSRRAFIQLARGNFEEAAADFEAATRLEVVDSTPVLFAHLAHVLAGQEHRSRLPSWESPFRRFDNKDRTDLYWPESGIYYLQGKITREEMMAGITNHYRNDTRAEAHYALSILARIKGDTAGEIVHLQQALETKAFRSQGYLLALVRHKELGR